MTNSQHASAQGHGNIVVQYVGDGGQIDVGGRASLSLVRPSANQKWIGKVSVQVSGDGAKTNVSGGSG